MSNESNQENFFEWLLQAHRDRIKDLGLPQNATVQQVRAEQKKRQGEKIREEEALKYGLPKEASWSDIRKCQMELFQEEKAKRGLPLTASWYDIQRHDADIERKKKALSLNLPEYASWQQIHLAEETTSNEENNPESE